MIDESQFAEVRKRFNEAKVKDKKANPLDAVKDVAERAKNILQLKINQNMTKKTLPKSKVPKSIYIIDQLPKSDRGKVLRDNLKKLWVDNNTK